MKADSPSRTAQLVALGRAMAHLGVSHVVGFQDPTARAFLTDKGKKALEKTEEAIKSGKGGLRVEYARTMGDMMGLRTMAIDAAVRDAIARGAKQLVILGAGYDGRAWRMNELAGIRVFEVDHPATQAEKKARAGELPPPIGNVTFVPIDFEREQLGAVLERAGHDRSTPTCWIWEGVVMYLTREAMRATLNSLAGRSAAGSTLIVNYHSANRRWLAGLIFRLMGEPMISSYQPVAMAAELEAAALRVREDSGMTDWNDRYARGAANVKRGHFMRIAVATR
jgi:methyltransferase (TIGR00027 family)